jgi:hypothetical protein
MRLFLPIAVIMTGGYSISIDARPIFQLYSVHIVLQQATQDQPKSTLRLRD